MATATSLRTRDRQPEIMDRPDLDPRLHRQALRGLARINRVSRTARGFWPELEGLARDAGRTLTVLDAACGGGAVAIGLSRLAQRRGVAVEVQGCDLSRTALDYARQSADRQAAEVEFFHHDLIDQRLPDFDAIVCSLFLHHLSRERAVGLLRALARSARHLVQVSDLLRTRLGYVFAFAGCRLLSRSVVVHADAPRSVSAAFTLAEVTALAEHAGLSGARICRRFPERFQVTWRRQ